MIARHGATLIALLALACGPAPHDGTMRLPSDVPAATGPQIEGAPVALNAESPVVYPEPLLAQRIEGTVLLRLYADSNGMIHPESTRVAESSGYPALDSAALAGAPGLRFAPAVHEGRPVATAFLQPIQFRSQRRR
ncbi:MAG TPA: energy transducer TonB [Gemmatimonadales bacterium]|nr:energy transducer TonB [Gemmatimonadales bacterium]